MPAKAARANNDRFAEAAEATAAAERDIQIQIDRRERSKSKEKSQRKDNGAMQAGARRPPEPPFPKQHLKKPGEESDLELAPMYDAPITRAPRNWKERLRLSQGAILGSVVLSLCCLHERVPTLQSPI